MGTDPLGIIIFKMIVMKKKYKCRLSASSLLVTVKGKVIRCELEPDVIDKFGTRGCSFTTEDKDLQHAIEHSPRFRRDERLDSVWTDDVEIVVPEKKVPEIAKAYAEHSGKVEAAPALPEGEGVVNISVQKKVRRYKAKKEA